MWKLAPVLLVLCALGCQFTYTGKEHTWPWGEGVLNEDLSLINLQCVKWEQVQKTSQTDLLIQGIVLASDNKTKLRLTRNEEGFVAQVLIGNESQITPRQCSSYDPFFPNMHYSGYINGDDQIDFALQFYCGGNGLNADLNQVTFLLSNENGYEATTIETFGGGPDGHFLLIKNKPHFIMKSFAYENECTDGKPHSFWIYNLLEIKGGTLYLANQNEETFPKIIRFTEKPNFKETDRLTFSQKENMLLSSLKDLGMNENRVPYCKEANP